MAHDGKYAKLITVCDPRIQGTAVCHLEAECSTCKFALKYEIDNYLKSVSEAFGAVCEASTEQIEKMSESYQKYGTPVCLCEEQEALFCPGFSCKLDIEEKGRCKCGIMKKKVTQ